MNEILDISIHLPEEYEGKCVIFNKVEYIIGKFVSQGASKIVHKLINKKSNICSHVIKIHRDISNKYLLYNELLGQALCRKMRVPSMQIFLADNGDKTYHIQELVTFNRECNSVLLKKGKSAFENKKYDEAYSIFQELLNNENPFNTEALLGIFLCSAIENGSEEHRDILEKVIEIEPNSSYYYEFLYLYLLKWKRYDEAKLLFEKSKIEVNFEISDLINNGNHIESLQAMIDKQLKKHIINYYSEIKIITLGEILKEYEDKVAFFRLFDKYKKTNDKVIFNSLASIAKDNPKTKIFLKYVYQ